MNTGTRFFEEARRDRRTRCGWLVTSWVIVHAPPMTLGSVGGGWVVVAFVHDGPATVVVCQLLLWVGAGGRQQ